MRAILAALLMALALPGLAADRTVTAQAVLRERIALPPGALVLAELRGLGGQSLGAVQRPTGGAQGAWPISLSLPEGRAATLHLALVLEGRVRWLADPVSIEPAPGPVAAGDILLRPFAPLTHDSAWLCGARRLQAAIGPGGALIEESVLHVLAPVAGGEGLHHLSADGTAEFRQTGAEAEVRLYDVGLAPCRMVPPDPAPPGWTAEGTDPAWQALRQGSRLEVAYPGGTAQIALGAGRVEGAAVVHGADALTLAIVPRPCTPAEGALPRPVQVTLDTPGGRLAGCGGAPRALLTGPEWVVEDLDSQGIIDRSHMTLLFGANGTVSGSGGCNRHVASYRLGPGLTILPGRATRMACGAALDLQEQRLFAVLARVDGFAIDATGALVLTEAGSPILRARRAL